MFKIGDFSSLCRVAITALRYYADIGLLLPEHIDSDTGYRYYSLNQLPRLNRILMLKELGLSLPQITILVNEDVSVAQMQGMLRLKEAELEQSMQEVHERLARVKARLRLIEQEGDALPSIVIKSVEAQPVLALRTVIPTGEYVGNLLISAAQVIMAQQVPLVGVPFTIFHDPEFKETDLDVEIVFPTSLPEGSTLALDDEQQMRVYRLDGLENAASALHIGSYDRLIESYTALARWIDANDYEICGSAREIYLRPPDETEEALTEIQFPVKKGKSS